LLFPFLLRELHIHSTTTTTESAAFYAAACAAVEQYACEHARMPTFQDRRMEGFAALVFGPRDRRPIARLLTCGAVERDVLPRADDTWLTLMPLEDLGPIACGETKRLLLTKRVRFMRLLARLPAVFPLHPDIDCVTESDQHPALSFWLQLLRALAPDFGVDSTKELERNLAALSRGRALRILISVDDPNQAGMAQSLALFFSAVAQEGGHSGDEAYARALELCGLTETPAHAQGRPVEVTVKFASGSVSRAVMETILGGYESTRHSPTFRLCCLRFSPSCALTESAVVLLGERVGQLSLDTLQLGNMRDVEPLSLRQTVATAAATVRRLVMGDRGTSISPIGSALRGAGNGTASVRELELEFCATPDFAEWLAFAVFHVDSPAHVSSLRLRFRGDVLWLRRAWINRF
jgi:hypothetical protein